MTKYSIQNAYDFAQILVFYVQLYQSLLSGKIRWLSYMIKERFIKVLLKSAV